MAYKAIPSAVTDLPAAVTDVPSAITASPTAAATTLIPAAASGTNYLLDGSGNILTDDAANRLTNA